MGYIDRKQFLEDVPWTNFTLLNGWVLYPPSWGAARYCRINGIVHIDLMIKDGTISTAVATLPVGFRPMEYVNLACAMYGNAHFHSYIYPNGNVTLAGGNSTWVSINASFLPEQ